MLASPQPWLATGTLPSTPSPPTRSVPLPASAAFVSAGEGDTVLFPLFTRYHWRNRAAMAATAGAECEVPEERL